MKRDTVAIILVCLSAVCAQYGNQIITQSLLRTLSRRISGPLARFPPHIAQGFRGLQNPIIGPGFGLEPFGPGPGVAEINFDPNPADFVPRAVPHRRPFHGGLITLLRPGPPLRATFQNTRPGAGLPRRQPAAFGGQLEPRRFVINNRAGRYNTPRVDPLVPLNTNPAPLNPNVLVNPSDQQTLLTTGPSRDYDPSALGPIHFSAEQAKPEQNNVDVANSDGVVRVVEGAASGNDENYDSSALGPIHFPAEQAKPEQDNTVAHEDSGVVRVGEGIVFGNDENYDPYTLGPIHFPAEQAKPEQDNTVAHEDSGVVRVGEGAVFGNDENYNSSALGPIHFPAEQAKPEQDNTVAHEDSGVVRVGEGAVSGNDENYDPSTLGPIHFSAEQAKPDNTVAHEDSGVVRVGEGAVFGADARGDANTGHTTNIPRKPTNTDEPLTDVPAVNGPEMITVSNAVFNKPPTDNAGTIPVHVNPNSNAGSVNHPAPENNREVSADSVPSIINDITSSNVDSNDLSNSADSSSLDHDNDIDSDIGASLNNNILPSDSSEDSVDGQINDVVLSSDSNEDSGEDLNNDVVNSTDTDEGSGEDLNNDALFSSNTDEASAPSVAQDRNTNIALAMAYLDMVY
ncbi:uncharacterized protein LOC106162581 isoform X2 [Lingula anatina]|uniref:Uncharacterized protein LOC106162581 isoform X1 n=1 Tax=Lingula anatina TaxID=7574 RepID=A0A1S3IAR6_LINAN|nr:uncharacterized protein LOC106162581 isoform X1 [Lingula anatina]XP_013395352.1 uncharacterized protein LOC106162581 isoform X2 [Lingula anatina]|eukprot:XP_013395351.1 uncharacterized protein LOC106162581 isoform X1 [Lingula anatina]